MYASHKRKRGSSEMVKEVLAKRGRVISDEIVRLFRYKQGHRPCIALKIEEDSKEHSRQFCDYLEDWDDDDFVNLFG